MLHNNEEEGFSLLETLIALIIASASLIIIIQSFADGFKTQAKANLQYEMARLAEGKLDEIEVELQKNPQNQLGTIDQNYNWSVTYLAHDMNTNSDIKGYWVEVSITRNDTVDKNKVFKLKRLIIIEDEVQ